MAQQITLTSGSIFNGNPITFAVTPDVKIFKDEDEQPLYPSFHRVILEVECNSETFKMSSPVFAEDGAAVTIDISSALRTFRDSHEYSPYPSSYPIVPFTVRAYDQYMLNGEVFKTDTIYYPFNPEEAPSEQRAYLCTLFGSLPDRIRLASGAFASIQSFSLKPSSPELVAVGEQFIHTPPYSSPIGLAQSYDLVAPQSQAVSITKEGLQTIGSHHVFALPATQAQTRQVFRFINSLGVLESVSVPRTHQKKLSIASDSYAIARQESFNSFSRSLLKKHNNIETWSFTTDPLTDDWLHWYLHDFLMSEHVWLEVQGSFLPCLVQPKEDLTFYDRSKHDYPSLQFDVQFDLQGSPL